MIRRARSGSAGRLSKVPDFQEMIFLKASSPTSPPISASIKSPFTSQIFPTNGPLVNLSVTELWDRLSICTMSVIVLFCTPRKPPCSSRTTKDSTQSTNILISCGVFGFSRYRSMPMA